MRFCFSCGHPFRRRSRRSGGRDLRRRGACRSARQREQSERRFTGSGDFAFGHLMPGNEEEAAGLLDAYLSRANEA